jgi:hypothetical protein
VNWLKEYVDFASEMTDAPRIYHEYIGMTVLATVMGNHYYMPFGATEIFPNLWTILIGPSSAYKKSTCIEIGERLLMRLRKNHVYDNEFSYEQMIKMLAERPYGVFVWDELKNLLDLMDRSYMIGTKSILTKFFACPPRYRRTIRNEEIEINRPCFSMMAGTTLAWFLGGVKEGDFSGGFLPRFLLIPATKRPKPKPFPPTEDADKRDKLVRWLADLSLKEDQTVYNFDKVKNIYIEWFHKFDAKHCEEGVMSASAHRLQIYVFKFSMILQRAKNKNRNIEEDVIKDAITRVNWLGWQLEHMEKEEITFDKYQENTKKTLKAIKAGKRTKSELLTSTRITAKYLDIALKDLIAREKIEKVYDDKIKPGRKTEIYRETNGT